MRVVLVEDHIMFRDLMRKVCVKELGWTVVGEADTGRKAKKIIADTRPELVLLDIHLLDGDGFEVAEYSLHRWPKIKILILSSHCNDYTLLRVEQSGAHGFVDKNTQTIATLIKACRALERDEVFYSAAYHEAKRARAENSQAVNKILSERERTILALIGEFYSNEEIAQQLGLAPSTVQTHRNNIMDRLSITSAPKLIQYANQHGFARAVTLRNGKPVLP